MVGLARHYHRSPDTLSADDVRRYLLHPVQERHLARSSVNQYGCAFRFLYGRVLGLDEQFIGRFLQHVLPQGFKRIRHYGLLAPAAKTKRLAQARELLAMPAANRQAREDAQAFNLKTAVDRLIPLASPHESTHSRPRYASPRG